jgi:hypothetical protein
VAKIVYSISVQRYLVETINNLYEKNYFGFKKSAIQYVEKIIFNIEKNIFDKKVKKQTPEELKSKGTHYIKYEANKTTTWYILFDEFKENYYINYIFNNHQEEAKFLK